MPSDFTSPANDGTATNAPGIADRPLRKLNVPNILSGMRLIGSPILAYLAYRNDTAAFVWLLGFLLLTDWIDGKLAILLKQQTTFGARLDTLADVAMYAALLFGTCWLKWGLIHQEAASLMLVVVSYGLSTLVGLIKFGRAPSYHTRAAKTCWLLVGIAAVSVFAEWSVWPLRFTMLAVTLTNLEAILITFVLPQWEADVTSVFRAVRKVRRAE